MRNEKEDVVEFYAKAKTLNSILLDSKAPKVIDFLSIDVEGSELEILKGIDFDNFKFKYILIECRDIDIISNFLSKKHYTLLKQMTHHDYLFKM